MLNDFFCLFRKKHVIMPSIDAKKNAYVSLREIIELANKKYKLFSSNKTFESIEQKNAIDTIKKKIITTLTEDTGIDCQRFGNKREYRVNAADVNHLIDLLQDYFLKKSRLFTVAGLSERDQRIKKHDINLAIQNSENDKTARDRVLQKIEKSDRYLTHKQMHEAERNVKEAITENVADDCLDVHEVIGDLDLGGLKRFYNDAFLQQLFKNLDTIKTSIIFQNSMKYTISEFHLVDYLVDYYLRELHVVYVNNQRIRCEGYSEYDIKLKDPICWYCQKLLRD